MKYKYVQVGAIACFVLALDQLTKYFASKSMQLHETIVVVPGFFNLTHVRNRGAAFSILSDMPYAFRMVFFVSVTLIAVGVIFALIRKTEEKALVWAFSLIAGGAIGNLIDRVRLSGEVVDFIQWYYKSFYWPSFNVADSAISVGVVLLAVDMLFKKGN